MPTFEIQVQLTGPLMDPNIQARFDREIANVLQELGEAGVKLIKQASPHGVSSGGGGLRGSIFTEPRGSSAGLRGQSIGWRGVPARHEQIIASSMDYASIVEVGRRPGRRPPFAPILLWVRRKLHDVDAKDARHVAFVIAGQIGARGTVGAHMFERSMQQLRPIAEQRFAALSARIAETLGGKA